MYTKADFQKIQVNLKKHLISGSGDPITCQLHNCQSAPGAKELSSCGRDNALHVAEACNIAGVISSVSRILTLPRSNVACDELSEILLLRLDVVREYVRELLPNDCYKETEPEKLIRAWAGFLKHPVGFVLSHRCFPEEEDALLLDSDSVRKLDGMTKAEKDTDKKKYINRFVKVVLPKVDDLDSFFRECSNHVKLAIEKYS